MLQFLFFLEKAVLINLFLHYNVPYDGATVLLTLIGLSGNN